MLRLRLGFPALSNTHAARPSPRQEPNPPHSERAGSAYPLISGSGRLGPSMQRTDLCTCPATPTKNNKPCNRRAPDSGRAPLALRLTPGLLIYTDGLREEDSRCFGRGRSSDKDMGMTRLIPHRGRWQCYSEMSRLTLTRRNLSYAGRAGRGLAESFQRPCGEEARSDRPTKDGLSRPPNECIIRWPLSPHREGYTVTDAHREKGVNARTEARSLDFKRNVNAPHVRAVQIPVPSCTSVSSRQADRLLGTVNVSRLPVKDSVRILLCHGVRAVNNRAGV
ncbi:hypothetical protein SKAU_G00400410 [Synaphobranchus kaupii]|uniref:Uncharacterized protein n=1 Tax=Synaphobranchus kaupii TaxID=118154 RepID=A0A9Q1E913_SYNKA|nr:hypothetical protein SKAU_G00400410 [Synaphobranchus kaupii]